jgi:hypothetical protein
MMVLQNYTDLGNAVPGLCAETCTTSHDATQAMNIKSEEVSDADEKEDPVQISLLKSIFFWDMTPCSALSGTRRFGGTSPPSSGL